MASYLTQSLRSLVRKARRRKKRVKMPEGIPFICSTCNEPLGAVGTYVPGNGISHPHCVN